MELDTLVWVWLIIAIVFFFAELITVGFVLAAFGVGALGGALVALFGLGLEWQLLVFVLISGLAVVYSRRFADRVTGKQAENVGVDRVLGKHAIVLEDIEPLSAAGRVRVEREVWRAQSFDDQPIPAKTVVEIVEVQGTRLLVRPLPDPNR